MTQENEGKQGNHYHYYALQYMYVNYSFNKLFDGVALRLKAFRAGRKRAKLMKQGKYPVHVIITMAMHYRILSNRSYLTTRQKWFSKGISTKISDPELLIYDYCLRNNIEN